MSDVPDEMVERASLRPANTTAATLYQVGTEASGADGSGPVGEGVVTVTYVGSGLSAKARVFHDRDGATMDETTALGVWDMDVSANTPIEQSVPALRRDDESIGVRTDTADDLLFKYKAKP